MTSQTGRREFYPAFHLPGAILSLQTLPLSFAYFFLLFLSISEYFVLFLYDFELDTQMKREKHTCDKKCEKDGKTLPMRLPFQTVSSALCQGVEIRS